MYRGKTSARIIITHDGKRHVQRSLKILFAFVIQTLKKKKTISAIGIRGAYIIVIDSSLTYVSCLCTRHIL